ncbi:hypothetical protein COCSUDRAFT_33865 [Coccomyxa subellipsoidea C-169]|uniref:Uncharacterized protein n=1 Tax=Coccomyxa subellipsoidea (strain C-169) TaxID=574566 RepID=I0YQP3_COCSC|nr:hypothetical protein COCSUDRAFT_33865 [Coccomyxa subellipsoidea C-169]EIE20712.1 hypothetical protein COCSUDRAFT_33865 [Coccomyxa subellipsoidea C-169]|eukprot:XP_005645256.1 hypothetical protein COCSUDRAFT_33865 [Coccomyxa subellipsoidea C-169]
MAAPDMAQLPAVAHGRLCCRPPFQSGGQLQQRVAPFQPLRGPPSHLDRARPPLRSSRPGQPAQSTVVKPPCPYWEEFGRTSCSAFSMVC